MPSSLQSHVDLPLIDISQFPSDFDSEGLNQLQYHPGVAAVREACKEWGFFSVVNHGISENLVDEVKTLASQLCAIPAVAKERAVTSNPGMSYYCLPCAESFSLLNVADSDSVNEFSQKIWPGEGNPKFCETIRTYALGLAELQRKIIKIIIASLGIDVTTFYHSNFEDCTGYLRLNHYFSTGQIMDEEVGISHTDISCFTILYQDNQGGLQIRSKEGEWLNVKPLSRSFVVNVADSLKAWSNGRYRSVEHRVVCKGWTDRFSMAYIVRFPVDKHICAPAELVDDEHPRLYRPFIFSDFEHEYTSNIKSREKGLASFIDRYAGI